MDDDNIEHLKDMRPKDDTGAKIELLGKYDPAEELIIRDPYYVNIFAHCLMIFYF